jgi:RNA polymerase sigma-70 factor (ECF subfamily)
MQFQDFDAPYLERLRSGDRSTQAHFVAYFGELIRLKLGKRLRSFAAIEDVQQETFARVLRMLTQKGINRPDRLGAFVNSVCNNVLHEHQRSAYRETPAEEGVVERLPDTAIGVIDVIATRQMQQAVQQILVELSEKDRSLIKALFFEERDKDELCCELGVDRRYLRVLLHRAKQSFKSHYLQKAQNSLEQGSSSGTRSFSATRRMRRRKTVRIAAMHESRRKYENTFPG